MVEYICEKCNKSFNKRDAYNTHLNRKYSCIPMEEPFSKLRKDIKEQDNIISNLCKKTDEQDIIIAKLIERIEALNSKVNE